MIKNHKPISFLIAFLLFSHCSFTQITSALWPLNALKKDTPTVVTGCMTTQPMVQGSEFSGNIFNNTYGFRCRPLVSFTWCKVPTDNYHVDFIIKPSAGKDINLDTIAFNATNGTGITNFFIGIYYQIDGNGPWMQIAGSPQAITTATTAIPIKFSALNLPVYDGHIYKFRLYVYNTDGVSRTNSVYIQAMNFKGSCFTAALKPAVTTTSASPNGKYECNAAATYDTSISGGTYYRKVIQNGFCWSTSNVNPKLSGNFQSFPISTGTITGLIKGLMPATSYYVQSYIITLVDTVYGGVKTVTTAVAGVPVLKTLAPYNVTAYKAISGGYGLMGTDNSLDSGGFKIVEKGIIYAATPNFSITTGTKITVTAQGNASYANCLMPNLVPNTKYYVKAYATNQLGTGYGNLDSFITATPVPAITANTLQLNFDNLVYNSSNAPLMYMLNAYNLPVGNDTITMSTAPPFLLSLSAGGIADSVLKIPVTGSGTAIAIPIYVQLQTSLYGNFSGKILHSGTGVSGANADTVYVDGNIVQAANLVSNWGTEFWAGYGSIERMSKTQSAINNVYGLGFSISASKQEAKLLVDIPMFTAAQKAATGFPKFITIPADSTIVIDTFPVGNLGDVYNNAGLPDTRLYFTGITNRAIHITSTNGVPVTIIQHIFANNNTAAASMLQPVSFWGSQYVVQSFGGKSNNSYPSSFFFIIPKEDNTAINFTPANDIVDSSAATIFQDNHTAANIKYVKGNAYTITLNKGQVFNAMGFLSGTGTAAIGLDLSGTIISSVDVKKKFAVFAGNSRCLIDTSTANPPATLVTTGSDNLFQQMAPTSLWGTKYFTLPTKTMEYNYFRIYIKDTSTQVFVNGMPINKATWVNNSYYQLAGNKAYVIEATMPISVIQFIVSGVTNNYAIGNNGMGDPEMITLVPVEMYTKGTAFKTLEFKASPSVASAAFVNIIIKKEGVASFKINNMAAVDTGISSYMPTATPYASSPALVALATSFKPYPRDTNYYYARFKLAYPLRYSLSSDKEFTAVVYGLANGESYGFNAGYFYDVPEPVTFNISGNVVTPNNKKVNRVSMNLSGDQNDVTLTGVSGNYTFTSLTTGNYKIRPAKNNDISKNNGVSIIDIILTQRHLLGLTKFNNPYKIIAADVNGNNGVSNIDVILMKRLILGIDTTFTSVKGEKRLWTFVDSTYQFPDSTNPFPYKDSISFTGLNSDKVNQSFIGVKLGDVDYNWNAGIPRGVNTVPVELTYSIDNGQLTMDNGKGNSNSEFSTLNSQFSISVTVSNFKDLLGLQYTLHFDNEKYEFVGIENNKLSIESNATQANRNGDISMLWTDTKAQPKTLEDGTELFTLVLKPKQANATINNLQLTINNSITEVEAWDKDEQKHNVIITKKQTPNSTNDKQETINGLTIFPNPAKTFISLNVNQLINGGNIVITDLCGKQVKQQILGMGINTMEISSLAKGMYLVSIITSDGKKTEKLVVE